MSELANRLGVYLHLAWASGQRQRLHARDRLLVLAGALSAEMQLPTISAYCRYRILQHNPQHLVGHAASFEELLRQEDFRHFLRQVERRYPPERAEQMLAQLGIEQGQERETYYSDEEYAAALLGGTPEELRREMTG